jgi:hypothetical protein
MTFDYERLVASSGRRTVHSQTILINHATKHRMPDPPDGFTMIRRLQSGFRMFDPTRFF